MNQIFDINII